MITRRGFFKLVAGGTITATALHILPVSALPLRGGLHDAIVETCMAKALRAWHEYFDQHQRPPRKGWTGVPFFQQLEVDLTAGNRVVFMGNSSKEWDAILIKGTPIYYSDREPLWGIRYTGR